MGGGRGGKQTLILLTDITHRHRHYSQTDTQTERTGLGVKGDHHHAINAHLANVLHARLADVLPELHRELARLGRLLSVKLCAPIGQGGRETNYFLNTKKK